MEFDVFVSHAPEDADVELHALEQIRTAMGVRQANHDADALRSIRGRLSAEPFARTAVGELGGETAVSVLGPLSSP